MARFIVIGAQRGQPLVPHQHEKALLGEIGRMGRVEAARAVLDGIEPVGRHGLAGFQPGACERLRREPFDRVAVEGLDGGLSTICAFSGAKPAQRLTYINPPGSSNCQKEPNISPRRDAFGDPPFVRRHHGPRE